jgi:hypothetical protein
LAFNQPLQLTLDVLSEIHPGCRRR